MHSSGARPTAGRSGGTLAALRTGVSAFDMVYVANKDFRRYVLRMWHFGSSFLRASCAFHVLSRSIYSV
jgi:hypothetical protein